MRALLTVFFKELIENARDRRTLLSALVIGPLGGPLLFTVMMNLTLERGRQHAEQALEIAVAGRGGAPNMVAYLEREGVRVSDFPGGAAAAADAVRSRSARLVLVIPDMLGGARFMLVGNLIEQQFGAARDWPFGSMVSIALMFLTLATLLLVGRKRAGSASPGTRNCQATRWCWLRRATRWSWRCAPR